MDIIIEEYSAERFLGLFRILNSIYNSEISQEVLEKKYLSDSKKIYIAVNESSVVGCAFIEFKQDEIRFYRYAFVSYVAVDEQYRKMGIARKLFEKLFVVAKEYGCSAMELTSANDRLGAHLFYDSIGFAKKKTTVFIKDPV